jgi:hypothetical protein
MTRVLKDLRPTAVIEAGKGIFAYRFEGTRTVVVLWSPNADATAGLALGASKAELINTIGETREITGQFNVPLKKGAPVYVVYR